MSRRLNRQNPPTAAAAAARRGKPGRRALRTAKLVAQGAGVAESARSAASVTRPTGHTQAASISKAVAGIRRRLPLKRNDAEALVRPVRMMMAALERTGGID